MLQDMIDGLRDPPTRHALLVHLPVALSVLGVPLAVAAAATKNRNVTLRWVLLLAYAVMALSALLAKLAGDAAFSVMGDVSVEARELADRHESAGDLVWLFSLLTAALAGGMWLKNVKLRGAAAALTVVAALFVAGWVAYAGHLGGELVYEHGVGTPSMAAAAKPNSGDADVAATAASAVKDDRVRFFLSTVRPILSSRCMSCHGPEGFAAGDLSLTTANGLLAGGPSGPAVVPGDPDASVLIAAVAWEREDLKMPKDEPQLPQEDIDALRRWVRDGAVWADP